MARQHGYFAILAALAISATSGCSAPPRTVPIRTIEVISAHPSSDTLVVMLPGIGDRAETFVSSGFLADDASDSFDLLAVDAHWRYYVNDSVVERLREDVIQPARARGYRNVWLVGVSLGGYGSLLYADRFPDDIDGLILLAPYLGGRHLAREVVDAGSLESWSGSRGRPERFERGWLSLKKLCAERGPSVILGYGGSDPLAERYGPLLQALPAAQVYTVDGGHEWAAWTSLWSEIRRGGWIQ